MSEQILSGIGCVLLGLFPLVAWWFAMFSDSDWGEAAREMLDGAFNLGRNTIAVIEPAVGSFLVFGGMLLLAQAAGFDGEDPVVLVFGVPGLVSLVAAVLGLIPVRLPGWMYPEWQLERRRRRAQEAARAGWEHEVGSVVPRGRHAAPPETVTGAGCRYGQCAGDVGGEDPLRSTDSLPMRAHLLHPDDNTGDPQ